jgi:deoxyribodipyrimidine photo-lyase
MNPVAPVTRAVRRSPARVASSRMSTVVLFTRDLRVRDNPALAAASRRGEIVPLFVLDETLLTGRSGTPNRIAFLLDSLHDLDESLRDRGAKLVIRRGDPVREALELARTTKADALHVAEDVSGYARRRQARLERACDEEGIAMRAFSGVTVVPPGELVPAGADHYRVFTPYWRAWCARARPKPLPAPRRLRMPSGVSPGRIPAFDRLSDGKPSCGLPDGGESAGRARLEGWLRRGGVSDYEREQAIEPPPGSQLSPYLHFGCLSAGQVFHLASRRPGSEAFLRQLCWRDFHHQVLAARPDLPWKDYRPARRRWRHDQRTLDAWRSGHTGVPIVDAAMRQLVAEGWMPNRARLIVASFLTKTLGQDWREGAIHFERHLVDGDLANNVGNWQWAAGTGNDTRPNRVLNPIRQAHRFDPDGSYVRAHVPELAGLEGKLVHEPWRLDADERRGLGYPDPVIEPSRLGARP